MGDAELSPVRRLLPAAVLLVVAVVLVELVNTVVVNDADVDLDRRLDIVAAELETTRLRQQHAVEGIARADEQHIIATATSELNSTGLAGLVQTGPSADSVVRSVGSVTPDVDEVLAAPEIIRALGTARDQGVAVPTAVTASSETWSLWIAARYGAGEPNANLVERREAVNGYVVVWVDVASALPTSLAEIPLKSPAAVLQDGQAVLGSPVSNATTAEGGGWQVVVDVDRPRIPAATGVATLIALVVVGLAMAFALRLERGRRVAEEMADGERQRLSLVAGAAPLLQESLDLGQVLPGFSVYIMNELDARGVAVHVLADDGTMTQQFAFGSVGSEPVAIAGAALDVIPAGGRAHFPLRRAGRPIGVLEIRAGGAIDVAGVKALRILADMFASTVANSAAYQRERRARTQLDELDRLKTEFLGTVSHELRTSSTAIGEFARLLDLRWEAIDDHQRRDLVTRIENNADSLANLVQQLLDFSRMDRHALQVDLADVDLGVVVAQVLENYATVLADHHVDADLDDGVHAHADPRAVERIAVNLISNAARYAPAGSVVHVQVCALGSGARLRVDDSGFGVPLDERERIFERFYRGTHDHVVETRGAGIGLAIVKELCTQMGAVITVADSPGGGARFEVVFASPDDDATDGPDVRDILTEGQREMLEQA